MNSLGPFPPWVPLEGISCAGWDIWLMESPQGRQWRLVIKMPNTDRYRLGEVPYYSLAEAKAELKELRDGFGEPMVGYEYQTVTDLVFKVLTPISDHPNYGMF